MSAIPTRTRPDPSIARLKELIIRRTGLAYYLDKDEVLTKKVASRLADLQLSCVADYADLLAADRAEDEWRRLIDDLVVNETFFFRNPAQFDALKKTVLPEIARTSDSLRVWCAGCASGAEPYSLNLILELELQNLFAGKTVSILGTDISEHNLERAREAVFTPWELRGMPDSTRDIAFQSDGRNWRLRDRFKRNVTFAHNNLATDGETFAEHHLEHFDIVFCRNVMIYFDVDLIRRSLRILHRSLKGTGWLVVGHAEPYLELINVFNPVSLNETTLYQRQLAKPSSASIVSETPKQRTPISVPIVRSKTPSPSMTGQVIHTVRKQALVKRLPQPGPAPNNAHGHKPSEAQIDDARQLANQGKWQDAVKICQSTLDANPMDADAHFLMALILENLGQAAEASVSLKNAIYIDRNFALAHYHLGLVSSRSGDDEAAKRAFRNVSALTAAVDSNAPVRAGDGLTASELEAMAKVVLKRSGG